MVIIPLHEYWFKNTKLGNGIKSVISGTCIQGYKNSKVTKKNIFNTPLNDIKKEIKRQLNSNSRLNEIVQKFNNKKLSDFINCISNRVLSIDDISSQFNHVKTTFDLKVGGEPFFAGNPYTLLVSLGGVIQEAISAFQIVEDKITFASAPTSGSNFFCVVLATTNVNPLT